MKRIVSVLAVIGALLVLPFTASTAQATTFSVTFTLSGAPTGTRVMAIGKSVVTTVAGTSGRITLSSRFKSGSSYAFSLHLLKSNGKYLGPVVFGVSGTSNTKKFTTNVKASSSASSLNAGTITYNSLSPGWAKSNKKFATSSIGKLLIGANATSGKPKGAGTFGLVPRAGVLSAGVHAAAGVSCPDTADQQLGGDCDGDGVVNAIDADDDNDSKLDIADSSTSGFESTKYIPWSTLYLDDSGPSDSRPTLNANIGSVSTADIEAAIGGNRGSFSINFFLNLPPGTSTLYKAAWIDCGSLSYCNSTVGTALTGAPNGNLTSEFNRLWCPPESINSGGGCEAPLLWRNYTGTVFPKSGFASKSSAPFNGLTFSYMGDEGVWAGQLIPNSGTGTIDKVRPGDPYTLNLKNVLNTVTSYPMSLGAFFLTVPALSEVAVGSGSYSTVDYTSNAPLGSYANPIVLDSTGVFSIKFWRPQRAAVAGVDPVGASFVDMGGLQYGLIMNVAQPGSTDSGGGGSALNGKTSGFETGCSSLLSKDIYKSVSIDLIRTPDDLKDPTHPQHWGNLWPLTDTTGDAAVSSARTINLTFDMKNCIHEITTTADRQQAEVKFGYTHLVPVQLTAAGVALTGGASRAAQSFWVQLPDAATGW